VGIITADDIIDIIQDSASEDIYRAVGMIDPEAKYFIQPLWERFWKRFIPVVIMIILGNISGWVINRFEEIIAHLTMLVFFYTEFSKYYWYNWFSIFCLYDSSNRNRRN
jgi:magnesium transporter